MMGSIVPRQRAWHSKLFVLAISGILGLALLISGEIQAARHTGLVDQAGRKVRTAYPLIGSTWPEGTFLHIDGRLEGGTVTDSDFGFSVPGVYLRRTSLVYVERETVSEERREKTYFWEPDADYSAGFAAEQANLEHVPIDPAVLENIVEVDTVFVPHETVKWPEGFPASGVLQLPDGYYVGANPDTPMVGDRHLRWTRVPRGQASVVARYAGGRLTTWSDRWGSTMAIARMGSHPSRDLIEGARHARDEQTRNTRITAAISLGVGLLVLFLRPR